MNTQITQQEAANDDDYHQDTIERAFSNFVISQIQHWTEIEMLKTQQRLEENLSPEHIDNVRRFYKRSCDEVMYPKIEIIKIGILSRWKEVNWYNVHYAMTGARMILKAQHIRKKIIEIFEQQFFH